MTMPFDDLPATLSAADFHRQRFSGNPPFAPVVMGWVVRLGRYTTKEEKAWFRVNGFSFVGGKWVRSDECVKQNAGTTTPDLDALKEAREAARERARVENTYENREAAKATWNAYEAAYIAVHGPRKVSGFASRAGRRQAAEMRALHPPRVRRALKPGYCVETEGLHTIHESPLQACVRLLRHYVYDCRCVLCVENRL